MKNKSLAILALVLLLLSLIGCSNSLPQYAPQTTAKSAATSAATEEATEKESTTAVKTTAATKAKTTKQAQATTAAKTETTQKTTKKKKHKQTTQAESFCYITVDCSAVLDNMDKLKEGHEEYVPENGLIIAKTKCTFKKGETVYDALERLCSKKGIRLSSRNTVYGIYIEGINNIDEFDCGKQSGWLYSVNGKSPSFSCEKYELSNADEIVFKYVC